MSASGSYAVRERMAKAIGAPLHRDFHMRNYGCAILVTHEGREYSLESTSNAGFRSIEASLKDLQTGEYAGTVSLGAITAWRID